MKKRFFYLVLFLVILLSACSDNDELSGKTFNIATPASPAEPTNFSTIMNLDFSDGKVVTNAIQDGFGTYELKEDELVLHFENENEKLTINLTLKHSDIELSKYTAIINNVDFEMTETDKVSHYTNLHLQLSQYSSVEFIQQKNS